MTFGRNDFLPVEPASCLSFLILLGRTKVRLKPLLLELYPSSSDELVKGPFSELRFRNETLAPSDSIKSNLQGYNSLLPLNRDPRFNTHGRPPVQEYRLRLKQPTPLSRQASGVPLQHLNPRPRVRALAPTAFFRGSLCFATHSLEKI